MCISLMTAHYQNISSLSPEANDGVFNKLAAIHHNWRGRVDKVLVILIPF